VTDYLRFAVEPVPPGSGGGFEVQIFVNGVDMARAGAGLGMDPYDVLVPQNAFVAGEVPATIPVARCHCGYYECGDTDATITRAGDVVRWDWHKAIPMKRSAEFAADAYDREVARLAEDRAWETPARVTGRLVLSDADVVAALAEHDLQIDWVANAHDAPAYFRVALDLRDTHQVFVDVPWAGRSPEELAAAVAGVLMTSPEQWTATWQSLGDSGPPDLIGPRWSEDAR
jgi:hypothetical protein